MPYRSRIEMNLTLRCQMACPNCDRLCHLYRDRDEDDDMDLEQVRKFVDQVRECSTKVSRLKLLGGEPLLHPRFVEVHRMLMDAVDEGLIQRVKIETNHVLPKPDVPEHPRIQWAGKPYKKKRHMPVLWRPADVGLKSVGICKNPYRCGISLDSRGFALCSPAIMIMRVFRLEKYYVDHWPIDWEVTFKEAVKALCPLCFRSVSEEDRKRFSFPLKATPDALKRPSTMWKAALSGFDGRSRRKRW